MSAANIQILFMMTPKLASLQVQPVHIGTPPSTKPLRHQLPFRYCASPAHWQPVDDNTCVPYARALTVAPMGLLGRVTWEVMASCSRTRVVVSPGPYVVGEAVDRDG